MKPSEIQQPAPSGQHITIDGEGNVIGDGNIVTITRTMLPANPAEHRNRTKMLQLVHNTWIKGVLEQSLHGAARLELGKDYDPQAVDRPWDMELHMPDRERRPVPQGTPILNLFDQASGALLILGEPGSGKTTTLLQLADALIDHAEHNETAYIPVIFDLSSWAVKQLSLKNWLLEEFNTKYRIPKRVARSWIENDALLLLLDGLDEVRRDLRDKCVTAINTFRRDHLIPLAICSRTADYTALTAKLHLETAVVLRSLTPAQIDAYLAGGGTALRAVRAALQHDPVLQELAQSPLMLSIMTLAYSGLEPSDLQTLATPETRRRHLLDTYIERMFQRRTKDTSYTPEQTCRWLSWLAGQLIAHNNQTIFLIENLQPDWLSESESRRVRPLARLVFGLVLGLTSGLVVGRYLGLIWGLALGLGVWLLIGLVIGPNTVKPVETLTWSWQEARPWLLWGLAWGLGSVLVGALVIGLVGGVFLWLGVMIGAGLFMGLALGLVGGLRGGEMNVKNIPNQGIRQSFRSALVGGLAFGLVGGPVGILCAGSGAWLIGGLGGVLGGALVGGMTWGGNAILLHYALRALFARSGRAPWNYARFLDYCADRIFLYKVGGGYKFIHKLLQEYFAAQYTAEEIYPNAQLLTHQ